MKNHNISTVLVTGGAGFVGSVLVPMLLNAGYTVRVLDLFIFGEHVFNDITASKKEKLQLFKGDIRDKQLLKKCISGCEAVIHLACISNDPSFELNPELSRSINYDAFMPLVDISKDYGVKRFIFASSSSVYGIKKEQNVTEDLPRFPLTDYSKYKALCEDELEKRRSRDFVTLILRPATVCGYSPRLRLDLSVNIFTNHAVNKGKITVFGGFQLRPNLHVRDCAELYLKCLSYPDSMINGKVYNAGYQNLTLDEIALKVKGIVGSHIQIEHVSTNDNRSYHISSEKIARELGYFPRLTIEDAISELYDAFQQGKVIRPLENSLYYNIKRMQEIKLT